MLTRIQALNYRCLRYVDVALDPFHVLVGPNASGKTTLLDVPVFLGEVLSDGLDVAIRRRALDPLGLLFRSRGSSFQLAVEARVPPNLIHDDRFETIRYELDVALADETSEPTIRAERVLFVTANEPAETVRSLFPEDSVPPSTLISSRSPAGVILSKREDGSQLLFGEGEGTKALGWIPSFHIGPTRSAFANLPEDETRFPAATWFKGFLSSAVQQIVLDSLAMRHPSPPGQPRAYRTDGTNLPWVVEELRTKDPSRFDDWIAHLRESLPDLRGIDTVLREEDRHRYLRLRYEGDLVVPSWLVSDGTLRLLALTLPAYLSNVEGAFLIEEPENGIHPRAIETLFQSISNVYDAQVLVATHSPVILSIAEPRQVLCFAKDAHGATDVVRGDRHPALADWQRETSLGILFAAGVLG